jgi:hypothetical protein
MKRIIYFPLSLLMFVFFLPCLFGFQKSDSIKTITRPYLGVYACEKLVFGGIDYTKHAQDLKIELCSNGKLVATAKDAAGKIRKESAAQRHSASLIAKDVASRTYVPYYLTVFIEAAVGSGAHDGNYSASVTEERTCRSQNVGMEMNLGHRTPHFKSHGQRSGRFGRD